MLYKILNSRFARANSMVKLKSFAPFASTTEAVVAATSIIDSTLDKNLKKFLKKNIKEQSDELAVADIKLGGLIKEKLDIKCVFNDSVAELFRGVHLRVDIFNLRFKFHVFYLCINAGCARYSFSNGIPFGRRCGKRRVKVNAVRT